MRDFQIKDVADIINGFAFESELFNNQNIGLPIVRIRDVVRGFSKTYYSGKYEEVYEVENGDLLIGMDGEFNIAQWKGGKALLNQRVCKIVSKPEFADQNYLKFRLQLVLKEIEDKTPFATVKHLSSEELKKSVINLPNPDEQKRIAAILDKADRLRRQRRFAQTLSDSFLQSVFIEMFGDPVSNPMNWKKVQLSDLGKVQTGNTPSRDVPDYYGNFIEWIKSDDIIKGEMFVQKSRERLSEQGLKVARSVEAGSILVTCIAGSEISIGNAAIANREVSFNQQINAITAYKGVVPLYLYGLLIICKPLVQKNTTLGMKRIITKSKFESLLVIKPPRPLQEKFAAIVQKFERVRRQQREATRQAEHLSQTLLHRAFRAEL